MLRLRMLAAAAILFAGITLGFTLGRMSVWLIATDAPNREPPAREVGERGATVPLAAKTPAGPGAALPAQGAPNTGSDDVGTGSDDVGANDAAADDSTQGRGVLADANLDRARWARQRAGRERGGSSHPRAAEARCGTELARGRRRSLRLCAWQRRGHPRSERQAHQSQRDGSRCGSCRADEAGCGRGRNRNGSARHCRL